ncbi:unnamed protein product [Cutaneotrichosporon oleaginosum]
MPHPDAVLPRERARALSFNAFTSRPDHWDMSILCARTIHDTYIEQARRGTTVVRSEEFTLTPALIADLEAQARLRASISAVGSEASGSGESDGVGVVVEEPEAQGGKGGRRLSEDEAFALINAWRYDPANPAQA